MGLGLLVRTVPVVVAAVEVPPTKLCPSLMSFIGRHMNQGQGNFRRRFERLDQQVLSFLAAVVPTDQEVANRKRMLSGLEDLIHSRWPEVRKLFLLPLCGDSDRHTVRSMDLQRVTIASAVLMLMRAS